MARRITIEIKVEEQLSRSTYHWNTLAEAELVSSVELFSPAQAAAAIVAGVENCLGIADAESAARAKDPVFADRAAAPEIPDLDEVLADGEAVPA